MRVRKVALLSHASTLLFLIQVLDCFRPEEAAAFHQIAFALVVVVLAVLVVAALLTVAGLVTVLVLVEYFLARVALVVAPLGQW